MKRDREFHPNENRCHSYQHKNCHDNLGKLVNGTGRNTVLEVIMIFL